MTAEYHTAALEALIPATLATCATPETRRTYYWQLGKFLSSGLPLSCEGIAAHLQQLRDTGLSSATVAQAVAAIRKLAVQALQCGLITPADFSQLQSVGPGRVSGIRTGVRLTIEQAFRLRWFPNPETYWGKRDACIMSLLLGCGLKRGEMADLKWTDCQNRDGRMWIEVDSGNKRRTIPVPVWTQSDMEAWYIASRLEQPPVPHSLRHMERSRPRKHDYIAGGMSADAIHAIIGRYGRQLDCKLTPNHLRPSLGRMMWAVGAPLEQIQYTLGHQRLTTTVNCLESSRNPVSA